MSIAGGIDRAVERGAAVGCSAIQIFTKSSNQWAARPLPDEEITRFKDARAAHGIATVLAHDSYLINLCSPDDVLWERSVEACSIELERCGRLGIETLVVHPGGHMGQGEEFGMRRLAQAIDRILDRLPGHEAVYQFWSANHWRPLVNGYSGYYPQTYFDTLFAMVRFPDDESTAASTAATWSSSVADADPSP